MASGRDTAVELTAFRASGAAFPGKDPEQGVSTVQIPGDPAIGEWIPNGIKLLKKLFGKKFLGYYCGVGSWNCVCSPVRKRPKSREFWECLGRGDGDCSLLFAGLWDQGDPAELQRQGEDVPTSPGSWEMGWDQHSCIHIPIHPCIHIPTIPSLYLCPWMIPPGADPNPAPLENSRPFPPLPCSHKTAGIPKSRDPFSSTWEPFQHLEVPSLDLS